MDIKYMCSGSRSTPAEFVSGDAVMNEAGRSWFYVAERDIWLLNEPESEFGPDDSTARSWPNLMHNQGPFIKVLRRLDIREP
jgi:hypothetical protein